MINYLFEKNQILKCEVWEEDIDDSDLIGQFSVAVNKLLTANNCKIKGDL